MLLKRATRRASSTTSAVTAATSLAVGCAARLACSCARRAHGLERAGVAARANCRFSEARIAGRPVLLVIATAAIQDGSSIALPHLCRYRASSNPETFLFPSVRRQEIVVDYGEAYWAA